MNHSTPPGPAASARIAVAAFGIALLCVRTALAACGDGIIDASEQCDPGSAAESCCLPGCVLAPVGFECRPAAGECDAPETCDGLSAACPTNAFLPPQECRPAAGACDAAEQCSGVGPACPVDTMASAGITCRPAGTPCDLPELCTGSTSDCPEDTGEPDIDLDGACDRQDVCPTIPDPTQADGDGDALGDACDVCTNIADTRAVGPRLKLSKLSTPSGDDRMRLKAILQVPDDPAIDPTANGLRVLLQGPLGVVFDAVLGGAPFDPKRGVGWGEDGPGRWWYRNVSEDTPRIAGIRALTLRQDPKDPGRLRLVVTGLGGDLRGAVGQPELTLSIAIDAPLANTGQCVETRFVAAGELADCRLLNGGKRLDCRVKR